MKGALRNPKISCFLLLQLLLVLLLHLPYLASGEGTCDSGDSTKDSKSTTLRYRVGALFAILVAGGLGVALPPLGKKIPALSPEGDIFFIVKAFAAGVILATGFIHILPDAFNQLTSPCLKQNVWQVFPFAGFISMVGALGTLMIDAAATGYYRRIHFKKKEVVVGGGGGGNGGLLRVADEEMRVRHAGHGHMHGHVHGASPTGDSEDELSQLDLIRHRVTAQVLELGIMVHSVIIGITVGASQSLTTIKPLTAALCFHQCFEGMALGGCITQAKFKSRATVIMALFFALTTPLGVAIGIVISNGYSENSPKSLIVQGVFDSAAAGILIYMALVDILAADFMNPKLVTNIRLYLGSNISLLLGAGCMAILAKWA
ncbi:hypothetical protein Ancab_001605 [Ancistrocladus abbreviatus]